MITVRNATALDASPAAAVHIAAWRAAYAHVLPAAYLAGLDHDAWTAGHRTQIDNSPPRLSLVALAPAGGTDGTDGTDGKVIGFIHAGPARVGSPPSYDAQLGEVYAIYVHPDAWGTGAGQALMHEAVNRLAADGRSEIVLWVLDDNPRARRFYERFGFEPTGKADFYTADRGGTHETAMNEVQYRLAVG